MHKLVQYFQSLYRNENTYELRDRSFITSQGGGGGGVQFSKRFHFGESILRINKM